MPEIDDPIEQARSQWLSGSEPYANTLTQEAFKKGFPVLGSVFSFWKSREQKQVLAEFNNWVLDFLKQLDQRVDNVPEQITPELNRIAAIAVERILWGASNQKAKRFAAVFASQFTSPDNVQALEDAAYFIRALDELSEDDIRVLKHLYNHQKRILAENHALTYNEFFSNDGMKSMLRDARNLGMQMDEFYARLHRLSGYGLALPLDKSHGSMGNPDDFAFRMTLLGRRLVDMLVKVGGESTEVRKRVP